MQPPQYHQWLSVKAMTLTPPFSSTILTHAKLWQHVQNPDNLDQLNQLLEDQGDLQSHLHYFVSLNQTIDQLQRFIDEQWNEMYHVYTELADNQFVTRIGPELFQCQRLQQQSRPNQHRNSLISSSSDSSLGRYVSARTSLINPPTPFYGNLINLNNLVIPSEAGPSSYESDINASPGSPTNPIDIDAMYAPQKICPREGHENRNWGHPDVCISCHGLGHDFADCPIEPTEIPPLPTPALPSGHHNITKRPIPSGRVIITCEKCTWTGHTKEECIYQGPPVCTHCGGRGHLCKDCRFTKEQKRSSLESFAFAMKAQGKVWNALD